MKHRNFATLILKGFPRYERNSSLHNFNKEVYVVWIQWNICSFMEKRFWDFHLPLVALLLLGPTFSEFSFLVNHLVNRDGLWHLSRMAVFSKRTFFLLRIKLLDKMFTYMGMNICTYICTYVHIIHTYVHTYIHTYVYMYIWSFAFRPRRRKKQAHLCRSSLW
jgi:hypothetical protein